MLIWSIFLTGVIALLFFIMYPRTDYIQTVETPIAQTAIVQFTAQHKSALDLALKAVQKAAEREDKNYQGSGTRENTLTIPYPDFATLKKTDYLPDGLKQEDWDNIQSRIVCIKYDEQATAKLSTDSPNPCSIGGYTNMNQTTLSGGTRDYLITYSPNPVYKDENGDTLTFDEVFPGWGSSWTDETKDMDTCGIVKNGKIQSPKCPNGLCDLSASATTTRLQNLISASGLTLENDGFVCISPIDHYAYDGVSITGKNKEMLAYYDGINNTWTGHSNSTTTWYDLSGNGNNGSFYYLTQSGNTASGQPLTSVSGWQANGYKFSGALDFLSLPEEFTPTKDDLKEQGVEILADLKELKNGEFLYLFVGLGNYYLAISRTKTGNRYHFNTLIANSTDTGNAFPWSRYLSSAEVNAARLSVSVIWKTNYKLMTQDFYLYGGKANDAAHANKFQYKKHDRSGIGAKMRNAIGISYAGASPSYSGRIYVARLYNIRLTPAQIALNYKLDRKRFNIPKVVDDNGNDYTYLQNDGVAFIKTGFIPTGGSKAYIRAKVMKVSSSSSQDYGGTAYGANHNSYFIPLSTTTGGTFVYGFGWYHIVSAHTVAVNNIVESTLTVNAAGTSADVEYQNLTKGTSYTITQASENGGTLNTPYDVYLFAGHNASTQTYTENATAKMARYTLWQDDVLARDFIPAEDPFGRPAMYDKVSGKFFYNANSSGKFELITE